jgi:regulator of PEP synthase PpsR (kinase-PPPase family)
VLDVTDQAVEETAARVLALLGLSTSLSSGV